MDVYTHAVVANPKTRFHRHQKFVNKLIQQPLTKNELNENVTARHGYEKHASYMDHMSHARCVAKSKLQALQDLRPFDRDLGSCLTLFGLGVDSSPFSRISFSCLFLMWFMNGLQAEMVPIQTFIARKTLPLDVSICKHCQPRP